MQGPPGEKASGQRPGSLSFDATQEYTYERVVLFWQPPSAFSQWTPSCFVIADVEYTCAEQYMMAEKAKLFRDDSNWQQVMATDDPSKHKRIGRMVRGYDQQVWDQHKLTVVRRGNYAKFNQNKMMREHLLDTGEKLLAEASPFDTVWGIGLRADDPAAQNPAHWGGQNLLGQVLQEVRARMVMEMVENPCPSLSSSSAAGASYGSAAVSSSDPASSSSGRASAL